MKLWMAHVSKVAMMAVALATTALAGCAIHAQSPIKEVAYDFSDADFYDRAYAPSPQYAGDYREFLEHEAPLRSSAAASLAAPGALGVVLTAPPGPAPFIGLDEADADEAVAEDVTLQTVGRTHHVSGEALRLRGVRSGSGH